MAIRLAARQGAKAVQVTGDALTGLRAEAERLGTEEDRRVASVRRGVEDIPGLNRLDGNAEYMTEWDPRLG